MKNFQQVCWGFGTVLSLFACSSASVTKNSAVRDVTSPVTNSESLPAFQKLTDDFTLNYYKIDPLWDYYNYSERPGPELGNELSALSVSREIALYTESLNALRVLRPALKSKIDLETATMFEAHLASRLKVAKHPWVRLINVNHLSNRIYYYSQMGAGLMSYPFEVKQDFENYILRGTELKAWSRSFQEALENAKAKKFKIGKNTIELLIQNWEKLLKPSIEESSFYQPLKIAEKKLNSTEYAAIKALYSKNIEQEIYPAIRSSIQAAKSYLPYSGKQFGIYRIQGDDSLYDLFREFSTDQSPLSAREIHRIGLAEVKRIRQDIEVVRKKMGFGQMSYEAFLNQVRDDSKSFYSNAEELTAAFRDAEKRVNAVVGNYFSNIPNLPLQLRGIPDPKTPAGSYSSVTDTVKQAYFNFNSADLKSTTRYGTHTLYLHEGVPGHHFQLSINYLLKPKFGKFRSELFESNTFVEGWALYAEYLGKEMGIYDTPELLLGTYNDEMMRAVRLVVDTGIHALGWSRKKAIQYMHSQLAENIEGVVSEIDRYSVWPGQALGYKLGQLEILKLRREAEQKLGARFDLKAFHRVVLDSGTVSIPMLRTNVTRWMDET